MGWVGDAGAFFPVIIIRSSGSASDFSYNLSTELYHNQILLLTRAHP